MPSTRLAWHVAGRPYPGEIVSGDLHVVLEGGSVIVVAVIDGLGHGLGAHKASAAVAEGLRGVPMDAEPDTFLQAAHGAARSTRGAAVSVACLDLDAGLLRWAGVGNVAAALLSPMDGPRHWLSPQPGIIGHRMPRPVAASHRLTPGQLLLLATDGLKADFAHSLPPLPSMVTLGHEILAASARDNDDALVFAGRIEAVQA